MQKSRVYPTLFLLIISKKELTPLEKRVPFSWIWHCIQGKSRLFELIRKKVDFVGTSGIFHLIILNTGSGKMGPDASPQSVILMGK